MDVKFVGQTYKEYLEEVRRKQFGWGEDKVEPISDISSVKVTKTRGKSNGKV